MLRILPYALLLCALALLLVPNTVSSAELTLVLPLNRTAYQTNEIIDLAVVRSDANALAAGDLVLTLSGADGSQLTFRFPVKAVPVAGNDASTTEHVQLNGWLLRPGSYTILVAADGATAQADIRLFTHIRKSSYRTLHWWGPGGDKMGPEGENGFGFNTVYGGTDEQSIRGGIDIMGLDLMGGGHQFDLKLTNDWSDPYVYIGAIQRGLDRAFSFRTMPNAIGAHLYDEPGLTYAASRNGQFGPWDVAPQRRAYASAFGKEQMWYDEVKPDDPANMAQWTQVTDFRLGFMDAFWKASYDALKKLKPGYLVATQSQYGWWALFDGYYFNVARSLPVISGHGGYDDYGERNFNPSYYVEVSLPRQMDKPTWYLGDWGVYSNEQIREEHYLSFITGIQGIAGGPSMGVSSIGASAGVETNKAMARLGTIFAKPAYTRHPLAIMYSKSDLTYATRSKDFLSTRDAIGVYYTATRLLQHPVSFVLEEDILDGTAAAHYKAIMMADINYLDPTVIAGLQAFMASGGTVMMTSDCTVNVPGAVKLKYRYESMKITKAIPFPEVLKRAQPLADELKGQLQTLGIMPAFGTTEPGMAPGRQVRGEIEYTFAVNFTTRDQAPAWARPAAVGVNDDWAADAHQGDPCAVVSTITLPDDGRPVYDGLRGGVLPFAKKGKELSATLRFGPGQMRVFARTARPIGGVQVAMPTLTRDYTRDTEPLTLDIAATLVDTENKLIAGTAPLEIMVTDPLGDVRYRIFRATEQGSCRLSLPMAVNDPAGQWTVTVKELLNNSEGKSTFTYQAVPQAGSVAGKTHRAVFYQYDKDNIYRFFRDQRHVTIVAGGSAYNQAAAERLATALKPYNVTCTVISATDANRARELSEIEAATWCGTTVAGGLTPGRENNPRSVGYDLPGPSILLGTPQDNPLISHLVTPIGGIRKSVLPYPVDEKFPGRGRGFVAWNYGALGHDLESVICIASDAEGMSEAVGTLFELAIGIDPLTRFALPTGNTITGATKSLRKPAAAIVWQALMPDTIGAISLEGANIVVNSLDGTQTTFDAKGKTLTTKVDVKVPAAAKPNTEIAEMLKGKLLVPDLAVKQVLTGAPGTAVSYWGGTLQLFAVDGTLKAEQSFPQDIAVMLWQGDTLIAGLAEGQVLALAVK